jgi:hypothetical protein
VPALEQLWRDAPDRHDEIELALRGCAADGELPALASECLVLLARLDRPAAVDVARSFEAPPADPDLRDLVRRLDVLPTEGGLEDWLDELGWPARAGSANDRAAIEVVHVLAARGRATWFDTVGDVSAMPYPGVLQDLAGLVSPDLDGVLFDLRLPAMATAPVLVAYMDGQRYETPAALLGADLDLDAVLGFVNALARERGAPGRVALVPSGERGATAVGGPARAIAALVEASLLRLAPPSSPR